MSGEYSTLTRNTNITPIIFHSIAFLFVFLAAIDGIYSGLVVVDTNVRIQFYLMFLFLAALVLVALVFRNPDIRALSLSFLIIFYAFLFIFSIPYYRISLLILIALVIEVREFSVRFSFRSRKGIWFLSFAAAITIMVLISGLIRVVPSAQNIGLLVASISDDVTPGGTPLLFQGGMVFFTRYLVLSISSQALLMFSILSFLLVENYFLIIGFVKRNSKSIIGGQVSGALTVLSCQCESITAAFPSIVSLILSAAIVPLIVESIVLVFMTNYLLRAKFMKGIRSRALDRLYPVRNTRIFMAVSSAVILLMPVLETVGVYLNWQASLYFFGGLNFAMLVAGIMAAIMITMIGSFNHRFRNPLAPSAIIGISSFAMLVWFYPPLTHLTVTNGSYFALMTIVSFAAGMASGITYRVLTPGGKRIFLEFLAMMFTMFAIIIFYVSVLSAYSFWSDFGLTEQIIFSIGIWVVALPFMWVATNVALNESVNPGAVRADAA